MSRPNISYPTPVYNAPGPSNYQTPPPDAASQAGGRRNSIQGSQSGSRLPSGPRPGPSALDSSITRLLVVTKQLLQALDQWAQGYLTENDVSDVYVRLGDIFETCVTAFNRAGISTRELNAIPNDLRICLEQALAEDASQESLNIYLPTIRQIIYNLLDGLKRKQAQYKRSLAEREEQPLSQFGGGGSSSLGGGPGAGLHAPSGGISHSQSHGQLPGSYNSVNTRRPVPPTISEDDRLSVSGRSVVSVASMGSTHSAPTAQVTQGRLSPTSGARGMGPDGQSLNKMPSSSALAERERERAQRGAQSQRPAPPDAFRPPRRVPSDGQPMRTSPSPKPPQAPLPEMRGVQLKDDGPVPSPPPAARSFNLNQSQFPAQPPAQAPALPPKAPSRIDRYSRDRDSFGNAKPVSRFSADSDITNGSPIKSPPSRSPPSTILPLSEEDDGDNSFAASGSKTSFSALSDAPSLPKLELPSVSLMEPSDGHDTSASGSTGLGLSTPPPPPDLPPESNRTLATLRGFDPLERRASKRFSSYTFNKMVPSSPNKGGRKQSTLGAGNAGSGSMNDSPQRPARRVDRDSVPPLPSLPETLASQAQAQAQAQAVSSSMLRDGSTDTMGLHPDHASARSGSPSGTSDGSSRSVNILKTPPASYAEIEGGVSGGPTPRASPSPSLPSAPSASATLPTNDMSSASVGKADDGSIAVFLQVGRQVKKATLELPITISTLRLLFMEKFEYDPGMDDFPEVYVNDKRTGVSFELEEMDDVREGCVLSLNIEPLDQVRQHFDHTFATLVAEIKEMKSALDHSRRMSMTPAASLLTVQQSPSLTRTAAPAPLTSPTPLPAASTSPVLKSSPRLPSPALGATGVNTGGLTLDPGRRKELEVQYEELQTLRRDLAIVRQLQSDFLVDTKSTFARLRQQNNAMKDVVKTKTGGSRALLDTTKSRLDSQSSETIQAVEEVQDVIDFAREDAHRRFVTPSTSQMKKIRADLKRATELADKFAHDVTAVEPTWRATWAFELSRVMEEQKLLAHQTKLGADLQNDVKDATKVWENVEDFVAQRSAQLAASGGGSGSGSGGVGGNPGTPGGVTLRATSRGFRPPSPDAEGGGMPNLLMEIRSKEAADPTQRLKAIEAQQRQREREKIHRARDENEFADELEGFVVGRKLKKTGGTEEVERVRSRRQEVTLRRMMTGDNTGSSTSLALTPNSTGTRSGTGSGTPVRSQGEAISPVTPVSAGLQMQMQTRGQMGKSEGAGSDRASVGGMGSVVDPKVSPANVSPATAAGTAAVQTPIPGTPLPEEGSKRLSDMSGQVADGEGKAGEGSVGDGIGSGAGVGAGAESADSVDREVSARESISTASTASFGSS